MFDKKRSQAHRPREFFLGDLEQQEASRGDVKNETVVPKQETTAPEPSVTEEKKTKPSLDVAGALSLSLKKAGRSVRDAVGKLTAAAITLAPQKKKTTPTEKAASAQEVAEPAVAEPAVAEPVQEATKPAQEMTEPVQEATKSAQEVAEPAVAEPAVAEPVQEATKSAQEMTEPVQEATKSAQEVAEPAEKAAPAPKKAPRRAARDMGALFAHSTKEEKKSQALAAAAGNADALRQSLDGLYGVHRDPAAQKKRTTSPWDMARYAVLFCCVFGFLFAGYFVFGKLYDYYRAWQVNTELQNLIEKKDRFADDYMKKLSAAIPSLTPQDILNGKTADGAGGTGGFSAEQENILSKIAQLKSINSDTVGWITIEGTVVNYPVVWSSIKNYYLHRDFYKKPLSGGTIYVDERNSPKLSENRNTVFYGHNMSDGSMFASLHDFQSATLFYDATIQLATTEGIFIYKPFSVHQADAYDNYFETNFQNDSDFIQFCEDMQFLSIFETEYTFTENSRIITLSTCMDNESATDDRFAVHAVLVQVIR